MSLPNFSTVNLFELKLDSVQGAIQVGKLTVNNQPTRDGWGGLVRNGESRLDVFIFTLGEEPDADRMICATPVYTEHAKFCPHCSTATREYPVQISFIEGYIPMYTCLCNRLDNQKRDFDTIRYLDIFDNQLVSVLPLRRLKKNESQIGSETSVDC